MKLSQQANRASGLTIIEVLIVVATLCLLAFLLLPSLATTNRKSPLWACFSNLKQLTLAEMVWANDYDERGLAEQLPTDATGVRKMLTPSGLAAYYQGMSNELISPRFLICPSDVRKSAPDFLSLTTNHLSYFLNMDARSVAVTSTVPNAETSTILHGDRQIVFMPPAIRQIVTLTTNLSIGWANKIHQSRSRGIGNVAFTDGSVTKLNDRDLTDSLLAPSRVSVQRLLFP